MYWVSAVAFLAGVLIGAIAAGHGDRATDADIKPSAARSTAAGDESPATVSLADLSTEPGASASGDPSASSSAVVAPAERLIGDDTGLQGLIAGWNRLARELEGLGKRVEALERQLAASSQLEEETAGGAVPPRARTAVQRQAALELAGVTADVAADIVWRQDRFTLDQLEVRDQAMREGWFGTDRYREELKHLREQRPDLRLELGEEGYDRYLYAAGRENRLRIDGVMAGSAAEEAGLQPGDLIEAYGDERVFTYAELRRVTSAGDRDELVPVLVRRADGSRVRAWVQRGPLGVRLDLTSVDPDL
jgi:hypothetical protein